MNGRELMLAYGTLTLLAVALFLPHLIHGGLYMDDWADAAGTRYPTNGPGFFHALEYFNAALSSCRPVLILFLPLRYILFGTDPALLLSFTLLLAIVATLLGYSILRVLRVPWYHAWLIAALTIAYPWYDSPRLWESASPITLALVFAFAGIWVALVGLERRSWPLHAVAALLYLLSGLSYEITLPLIAAMGVLYIFRAGWRTAWRRWLVDLAVVVAAALWDRAHTPREISTLSGDIKHLWEIVTQGGELLGRTLFPLGLNPRTTLVLLVLLAIGLAGLAAYWIGAKATASERGWGLRGWLFLGAAGLLIAALGWVMFIPANPYYTPSVFGFTNRVNGVAGFGLVLAVYSALGIVGVLIGRLSKRQALISTAAVLALGVALGATYVHVLERHIGLWDNAYKAEVTAAEKIKADVPRLPADATLFTSSYPAYETLGVPIFATTWDLAGRLKLLYDNGTVRGFPITEELTPACWRGGIGLAGRVAEVPAASYGTAWLLNLETGQHSVPKNQAQCRAVIADYPPGPLYLNYAY